MEQLVLDLLCLKQTFVPRASSSLAVHKIQSQSQVPLPELFKMSTITTYFTQATAVGEAFFQPLSPQLQVWIQSDTAYSVGLGRFVLKRPRQMAVKEFFCWTAAPSSSEIAYAFDYYQSRMAT